MRTMSRHGDPAVRQNMGNVDPTRTRLNRFLIGSRDMESDVKAFHASRNPKRRKGDDTEYAHILLLASPQYFQTENNTDHTAPEKLEGWVESSIKWAKEEFGGNLVHARLDLDEATPHIDLAVVPTYQKTSKRGKVVEWLSFRQVFGVPSDPAKKFSFEEWQDKYAGSVEHLGLKRGEAGSKTRHVSPAAFRAKKIAGDLAETEAKAAFEARTLLDGGLDNLSREVLVFSKSTPEAEISRLTHILAPSWGQIWRAVKVWSRERKNALLRLRDDTQEAASVRIGASKLLKRDENEILSGAEMVSPSPQRENERGLSR